MQVANGMVLITGDDDIGLIPFGDNIARSTPVESADLLQSEGFLIRGNADTRPFVKAAEILKPTIDQKFEPTKRVKPDAPK